MFHNNKFYGSILVDIFLPLFTDEPFTRDSIIIFIESYYESIRKFHPNIKFRIWKETVLSFKKRHTTQIQLSMAFIQSKVAESCRKTAPSIRLLWAALSLVGKLCNFLETAHKPLCMCVWCVCVCFMYLFHFLVPKKLPIHIYNIGQTSSLLWKQEKISIF